jgi:hypothetical protein
LRPHRDAERVYPRVIPFTQYLRPHGHKVYCQIDRPDRIVDMAEELIHAGFRFECEHLMTNDASFTILDLALDEDVAIEVVPNGPAVSAAVDRLVERFYKQWKNK